MKGTGVHEIDIVKNDLDNRYSMIINLLETEYVSAELIREATSLKSDIEDFRYKLGWDRGTEFIEMKFGWNLIFGEMNINLEKIINQGKSV
jgi:hypothetical protein